MIREVSAWLRLQDDVVESAPSAISILEAFGLFRQLVGELKAAALERESWADLLLASYKAVPRS